jgi:hypothetical protein
LNDSHLLSARKGLHKKNYPLLRRISAGKWKKPSSNDPKQSRIGGSLRRYAQRASVAIDDLARSAAFEATDVPSLDDNHVYLGVVSPPRVEGSQSGRPLNGRLRRCTLSCLDDHVRTRYATSV